MYLILSIPCLRQPAIEEVNQKKLIESYSFKLLSHFSGEIIHGIVKKMGEDFF
jgi:hypothetical protein